MKWQDEKAEIVAKSEVVRQALEGKAIRSRLNRITLFGFGFIVETQQDLSDVLVSIYEKWEDVSSVFISAQPEGRLLWVGFKEEGQTCA